MSRKKTLIAHREQLQPYREYRETQLVPRRDLKRHNIQKRDWLPSYYDQHNGSKRRSENFTDRVNEGVWVREESTRERKNTNNADFCKNPHG